MSSDLPSCSNCGIAEGCKIKGAVMRLKTTLDEPIAGTGQVSVNFERVYESDPLFMTFTTPTLKDERGTYRMGNVTKHAVTSRDLVIPVDKLEIFGPEGFDKSKLHIPQTINISNVRAADDTRVLIDRGAGNARFFPILPVGAPQWVDQKGSTLTCHLGPKSYLGWTNNIIHA